MQLVGPSLLFFGKKMCGKKGNGVRGKKRVEGGACRILFVVFLSLFFFSQYNRRAWSVDEMAIPSILRDMGPDDVEAE